jgi:hypothetical protein
MMYECIMSSLTDEARANLMSKENTNFHEDGPTLLHILTSDIFRATFSSAQSTRDQLSLLQPSRYKYDVKAINNVIRAAVKTLRAGVGTINNPEIFYYQFKIYKRIKAPLEWTSKILMLENTVSMDPTYTPETLYADVEAHYDKLLADHLWKPSERSPEEQIVAMTALKKQGQGKQQQQQSQKGKQGKGKEKGRKNNADSSRKRPPPPFKDSTGNEGDKKEWKGQTYYFCPAPHRNTHWHTHTIDECFTYKKWKNEGGSNDDSTSSPTSRVVVDRDKLKRGMAALFPSGTADYDPDDLAEALLAALRE